ncbi:hypothetical protein CALCODRAFT_507209 [Calocera cornea HHB12733]|uniref:BTB domain-containing protein n=1 Tax=Calocera cornea HHB12733 TaxID=1353952 RepID=A0A165HWF7_9BASI|nr:hypothetical protein CALCODRAFT_507209 [Calocera cornea HHB12733]
MSQAPLPGSPPAAPTVRTLVLLNPGNSLPGETDIIIRSGNDKDFRAHKLWLSFVSPVWKAEIDALPCTAPPALPVLQLAESADVLRLLLQSIYPVETRSRPKQLDRVRSGLEAAAKYEIKVAINTLREYLVHHDFLTKAPLAVMSIALARKLRAEADRGFEETFKLREDHLLRDCPVDLTGRDLAALLHYRHVRAEKMIEWLDAYFANNTEEVPRCEACGETAAWASYWLGEADYMLVQHPVTDTIFSLGFVKNAKAYHLHGCECAGVEEPWQGELLHIKEEMDAEFPIPKHWIGD